jgi:transporter family-2 protein
LTNLFLLFAIVAGAGVAVQAAINSRLRFLLGAPVWAASTQFVIGLVALVAVAIIMRAPLPPSTAFARAPWWMWTGGFFGAAFILMTVVATPRLGAALMLAGVIVGQLAAALLIDHFGMFGAEVIPISAARVAGVLLLVGGVALIRGL